MRTALWPPAVEFWGLAIGAQDVVACQVRREAGVWRVAALTSEATPISLYKESPTADIAQRLTPVLAKVAGAAAKRCVPFHVVIPDPAISMAMLELETLPKTGTDREALAHWHLQKLWPTDTHLACIVQDMGKSDTKHYLLTAAMARAWLDGLLAACHAAQLVPTRWQSAMVYRFGQFETQLRREGSDGVLLAVDTSSWSLLIWDAHGRTRHLRSRWRESLVANEAGTIAVETERAVRAYVHGQHGRRIDAVHLLGESEVANRVAALLEARMQNACVRLSPLAGVDIAPGVSLTPDAALAVTAAMGNGR